MPKIENILFSWAYIPGSQEWNIKLSEIIAWLNGFHPSEMDYAIKILENIQYYNDNKIRTIISKLSSKIRTLFGNKIIDTLFFPLGYSSASSGSMYIYQYRKELSLSETNFKQDSFKNYLQKNINIVFFDDIIGTGNQATRFFDKNLRNTPANYYYFSLLGLEKGIAYIQKNANFELVIVGEELSDEEMAFTENSFVFTKDEQNVIKPICEKYGRLLYEKYPLGYDNTQALIVFPHNTPNNTLPIIWASDKNEARYSKIIWNPLFERKKILLNTLDNDLKRIQNSFSFNRDLEIRNALEFVKYDFIKNKYSRRLDILGKSGTGKTFLIKNIITNLDSNDNVLYIDLNSDDFFINLFFELLIYYSLKECYNEDGIRIQKKDSFLNFLENHNNREKEYLIQSLYAVIKQLPGMEFLTSHTFNNQSVNSNKDDIKTQNISTYFFKYINWITKSSNLYLVIDNYQFLTDKLKDEFETNISFVTNNLCFITIFRLKDYETITKLETKCFLCNTKKIFLSELDIKDITSILQVEFPDYKKKAADCFLKTHGNLKEIEYYLAQLRQNISSNKREDNIRSLIDNIKFLPDLERYLMTISSLFPTGMEKRHINRLMQIILLVDEQTFNEAINSLIEIGYLILNGNSGSVLKPAHEKIISSISKSLGDDIFLEMQTTLVNSLELLLDQMVPTKEYNYLLHCFVGIFTAEQLKSKLSYVIKLLDLQYKSDKYYYLITFYKSGCKQYNWSEIIRYLPLISLEQLLDSMQKTAEFYCGMELLYQIKHVNYSYIDKLKIYEVKFLTQTYCFEQALDLIETFDMSEQTILYKLNILQHLGKHHEAQRIVCDLIKNAHELEHSEYFYVILRNTTQYFSFNSAISNLQTAQSYFNKKGLKFSFATVKNNLGVIYLWGKEYDVAEQYLLDAETILDELNSNEIFEPQCNLSVLYSLKNLPKLSLEYSEKTISTFPKNLSYDYVMLQNNQRIIKLEQHIESPTDTLSFLREQYKNVNKFMDPWLTFIIEYNLNSLELFFTNESSIKPNIEKYCQYNKEEKTGSLAFKDIEIDNKKVNFVFALSPNWRY